MTSKLRLEWGLDTIPNTRATCVSRKRSKRRPNGFKDSFTFVYFKQIEAHLKSVFYNPTLPAREENQNIGIGNGTAIVDGKIEQVPVRNR